MKSALGVTRELGCILQSLGCAEVRQRGSHLRVACGSCATTVPVHFDEDVGPGLLLAHGAAGRADVVEAHLPAIDHSRLQFPASGFQLPVFCLYVNAKPLRYSRLSRPFALVAFVMRICSAS